MSDEINESCFMPYRPEERSIYRYNNGSANVAADPLLILRKLKSIPGLSLQDDMKLAAAEDEAFAKDAEAAIGRLAEAVRQAFNVPAFAENGDGQRTGLMESECLQLLIHFSNFIGGLAKAAGPFPSSPENTEPADSVGLDTPSLSDSPSIASE